MRSPRISGKSAAGGSSAEAGAGGAATHDKYAGKVQKSVAAIPAREIADPDDTLRSPLLIREIEVVCGYRGILGIKEVRRGIKRHRAARDGSAIDFERARLQVDGVRPGSVQIRINAADAGSSVIYPEV